MLSAQNAKVEVYDPSFTEEEIVNLGLKPFDKVSLCDVIFIQTADERFLEIDEQIYVNAKVVFDGRGLFDNRKIGIIHLLKL